MQDIVLDIEHAVVNFSLYLYVSVFSSIILALAHI